MCKNSNCEKVKLLQQKQLEILKEIIRICEKYKIQYTMAYGSLIGAVRHNGFIPWDDDLDIIMMRQDLDKFKEVATKELKFPYFFQDYTTDKEYPGTIIKIRDTGTTLIENGYRNLKKMNHGIWVDILVADEYKKSHINYIRRKLLRFYKRVLLERASDKHSFFARFSCLFPREGTFRACDALLRRMGGKKPTNDCIVLDYIYSKSMITDTTVMKFEGIDVSVPKEYDNMLRQIYGDYMKLPPKEQQIPRHMTELFSLDVSSDEYFRKNDC